MKQPNASILREERDDDHAETPTDGPGHGTAGRSGTRPRSAADEPGSAPDARTMSRWAGWRDADVSVLGAGRAPVDQPTRGNKYHARTIEVDGHRFDSKHEYAVYQELKAEEAAGQITDLRRQRAFPLLVKGRDGLPVLVGRYTADFVYRRAGRVEVVDAKSRPTARTEAYRLRSKLFTALYGLVILER